MRQITKHLFSASCFIAGFSSTANAAVIHFSDQEIPIPTTFAGVSVNLETSVFTNDLAGSPGADTNFLLGGAGITNDADESVFTPTWQPVRSAANNSNPIVDLGLSTIVDGTSLVGTDFGASGGVSTHFATFIPGTAGHVGFSLVLQDNTLAYGWMRVTLQDDNTPGVIHEWAFEDTGAPIRVGQVPEPSSVLLSMLGLTALAFRRRS